MDSFVQSKLKTKTTFAAQGRIQKMFGTKGIGAVIGRGVSFLGWATIIGEVSFELGTHYGPSTWYGKDDAKWFE